jgi:cytosine/adenosine deaminase-related metal-dependent hydrolase
MQGKLIKSAETNASLNMTDARDKDVPNMSLSSALEAHQKYHGSFHDRCHIWFACGTPRGSSISAHSAVGSAAHTHDIGVTMHCVEASKDLEIFREQYDCSPLEFCKNTMVAGPKTVLAHVVHPNPSTDYDILRDTGTTVSHNPTSNCKLGSGIAPIPDMVAAGVNVSLGTDGAPCNNVYDMFREMHLAAILHSGSREEAGVISAYTALEFATINGARALGLDDQIGSLEVGKKADFVMVNPGRNLGAVPWDSHQVLAGGIDPVTVVVHSCTGSDVDTVVVDGRQVVIGGKLVLCDEGAVVESARRAVAGIRKRSQVGAKNIMGLSYC